MPNINPSTPLFLRVIYRLLWWSEGWVMLFCGILTILTFGLSQRVGNMYGNYLGWSIMARFGIHRWYYTRKELHSE